MAKHSKMRLRKKAIPAFNPFNPKDRARVEGKIFSDEWVNHNSWMGDENKKSMKIRMPTYEEWLEEPFLMDGFIMNQPIFEDFYPPMFFNFQKPIPVPIIRQEMNEYEAWEEKQNEKMAIFKEMMSEKGIRAGRAGVGEAHKGWGRSKRKY
ncbi:MAG: hypothetical protein ACTSSE_19630 [Candidatus Thorarchaeota archaeon]